MSEKTRERTLYEYIGRVFNKYGCSYVTQVGVGAKEPDLIIEFDGSRVVSEVKIDSEIKLEDAIVDANAKAFSLKTPNAMALLFPRNVRDIPTTELEKVFPNLTVASALVLTEWASKREASMTLDSLASLIVGHHKEWLKTKTAKVDYGLVVDVARIGISQIGSYLRTHLTQEPILNSAMAVIGRFDIYKSLLEDVSGIPESEAKLYIADIASYILANQLLFYQIVSEKMGYEKFPDFNPILPPTDLLDTINRLFEKVRTEYSKILGLDLFPLLSKTKDLRIVYSVARLVSELKMLRPQHIQEDLFGRLYHETIPPDTKKNLGAFYTKPEAAKFLATLAIDRWDAKVLDPSCGSGTLLVEAYQRKAKLAPTIEKDKLARRFIEKDIYGIDVMHFAAHMTTMNLTSQDIRLKLEPNVFSRDGIETMVNPINSTSAAHSTDQALDRWIDSMKGRGIPNDFDIVIMNPPFTRREKIPDEISKLQKMVQKVKGKTGYWAYFVVAADNVLRKEAVLAVVMPEEFFVGGAAKSVREYLLARGYSIRFVVRSAKEIAFSEAAHYRDYLIVFSREPKARPLIVTILKKRLKEIVGQTNDLIAKIKEFSMSNVQRLSLDELEGIKISDAKELLSRYIGNLKPLIGFNTVEAYTYSLELLDRLKKMPTIDELDSSGLVRVGLYRPGQYKEKGVERFAEKLFISKYGGRSSNVTFLLTHVKGKSIELAMKRAKINFRLHLDCLVPSLRTYSGVKHLDISNEEEFGIVSCASVEEHVLQISGLLPREQVERASKDIREAYANFAGNLLLTRRIRLTSPNAFWLAFYSDNKVLGSQLPVIQTRDKSHRKVLALYLNSTICLLQLLSFLAETEGAYVSLDNKRVWSFVHVPDLENLKQSMVKRASDLLSEIGKVNVSSLLERIKNHDNVQRAIDEFALELVGLTDLKRDLYKLYDAVAAELESMKMIESPKKSGSLQKTLP
jgi:16S rRNA G966 N2-methylase RsmD